MSERVPEPCPFCGGTSDANNATMEPKVNVMPFKTTMATMGWRVECRCGVRGRGFEGRAEAYAKAVEFWNTRAAAEIKNESLTNHTEKST